MLKGIKKKIPTPKPKPLKIKDEGKDLWGAKPKLFTIYDDGTKHECTPDQELLYEALTAEGFTVTFPDDETYQITKRGKTDTGNINQDLNSILLSARRLG